MTESVEMLFLETRLRQRSRSIVMIRSYSTFKRWIVGAVLLLMAVSTGYANVVDSLRMERRAEGLFIIHRVEAGETLFSLTKRYGADLAKIVEVNKIEGYSIDVGQILAIPYVEPQKAASPAGRTVHRVKTGETLYAISHIYGVNIYDIKKWNNLTSDDLALDQQLIVSGTPTTPKAKQTTPDTAEERTNVKAATDGQHAVEEGETLYAIARKYQVTYAQLKEWNKLTSDDLAIGQILRVSKPADTDRQPNQTVVDTPANDPPATEEDSPVTQPEETPVKASEAETPIDSSQIRKQRLQDQIAEDENQFEKVYEEGVAMEIENSPNTKKYLCLHRSLPTGKVVQVKNLMNGQSIFVRIIGKLPPTGNNENVLIRLSSIAYKRLGAVDARFPVELSYIPD